MPLRLAVVVPAYCLLVLTCGCGSRGTSKSAPELIQDLKSQDEAVRIQAARGLGEVGHGGAAEAVRALVDTLRDGSPYVRQAATRSLGAHGANAREAVPALQKALKDSDEGVRLNAQDALKKIQGS